MTTKHWSAIDQLPRDAFAVILAGGNGTRLGELTRTQCKPAIPFAGQFRNIDFTLSNCINSGVRRIAVATQYKAQTLIDHITNGWNFLPRALGEFVDIWPAQQRVHSGWYSGTADAVYQNLDLLEAQGTRYTLVLAGDHIYTMDYRALLAEHVDSGADVTVSCVPIPIEEAGAFGVLGVDGQGRVQSFIEKPAPATLRMAAQGPVLASMGIYVFTTQYLIEALRKDAGAASSAHDFGRNILPAAVHQDHVQAHLFVDREGQPGYWRDVGTLDAYWQAHMELLQPEPPIDLHDPAWPIGTLPASLPPARLLSTGAMQSYVANSLLAGGTIIRGATVTNSVLANNVRVGAASTLDETVALPNASIGANCRLRRVIVGPDVVIPDGTSIGWAPAERLGGTGVGHRVTLVTRDSMAGTLRSVA
jgi:glucose-1-phosphate adenylyltransferase